MIFGDVANCRRDAIVLYMYPVLARRSSRRWAGRVASGIARISLVESAALRACNRDAWQVKQKTQRNICRSAPHARESKGSNKAPAARSRDAFCGISTRLLSRRLSESREKVQARAGVGKGVAHCILCLTWLYCLGLGEHTPLRTARSIASRERKCNRDMNAERPRCAAATRCDNPPLPLYTV